MQNNNIILAVVLGSGLGEFFSGLPKTRLISKDTAGIHEKIVFISEIEKKDVLFFSGRKHFYEGYSREELTANMETAASYGVKNVLITNAAGGINDNFRTGDMMLINSHINLNQKLVLPKSNFPYSVELNNGILDCCNSLAIDIQCGVYGCLSGPTYESPAEIKMLRNFGCDAMGMSTIPEVFSAKKLGMNVSAISVITNLLRENSLSSPMHDDIVSMASGASENLFSLIKRLVLELN